MVVKMNDIVYACKNKNRSVRMNSTSGGVFRELASYILAQGGIVYGVTFDEEYNVVFSNSDNIDYREFSGSKYPQADLGNTFIHIKENLNNGRTVMFVGCPCQVAGLSMFLNRDYDNLILVDFICMGIASPGLWKRYLSEEFAGERIKSIRFKDKSYGWHNFRTIINTHNKKYVNIGVENPYMKSYLKRVNIRPSCYECKFKGKEGRMSDITISDCWGIDKILPWYDDNKGISGVYINSVKGDNLFEICKTKMTIQILKMEDTIKYNEYYWKAVERPDERDFFWHELTLHSFCETVTKLFGISNRRNSLKSMLIGLLK